MFLHFILLKKLTERNKNIDTKEKTLKLKPDYGYVMNDINCFMSNFDLHNLSCYNM